MSREARVFAEGSLRTIQASGTGGWNTGSAALTALLGFVQAGMTYNSARDVATVMERGLPHHHKIIGAPPIEVQFTYLQAVTANRQALATSSGVSTPQAHMEIRHTDAENPTLTAQYFQMHNGVKLSEGWTEGENGNQWQESWRFLAMVGPTGSGYIL